MFCYLSPKGSVRLIVGFNPVRQFGTLLNSHFKVISLLICYFPAYL